MITFRSYKHELHSTRKELEEKWQKHEVIESHQDEMSQRLKDLQRELDKSEKTRQEIAESYRKSENEHAQIVESYKARQNKLNEKVIFCPAEVLHLSCLDRLIFCAVERDYSKC